MSLRIASFCRAGFLLAFGVVIACVPWLWLAERSGWSQRPIHFIQTFLAVPMVWLTSVGFLWFGRKETDWRSLRVFVWFAWSLATLWLAFIVYVLFIVDLSVMNQR